MIISDLNYMEATTEVDTIVGGGKKYGYYPTYIKYDNDLTVKVASIKQTIVNNVAAVGGDAYVYNSQSASINQQLVLATKHQHN